MLAAALFALLAAPPKTLFKVAGFFNNRELGSKVELKRLLPLVAVVAVAELRLLVLPAAGRLPRLLAKVDELWWPTPLPLALAVSMKLAIDELGL